MRCLALLMAFTGVACSDAGEDAGKGNEPQPVLGRACVPAEEASATFSSFAFGEVTAYENEPECEGLLCVVNDFQGRVTCPYGQTQQEVDTLPASDPGRCRTTDATGKTTPVAVELPVPPQHTERRAADAVICSCRCAGNNPDLDYCTCASNQICLETFGGVSYCVKSYDPAALASPTCAKSGTDSATDCGNGRRNP